MGVVVPGEKKNIRFYLKQIQLFTSNQTRKFLKQEQLFAL